MPNRAFHGLQNLATSSLQGGRRPMASWSAIVVWSIFLAMLVAAWRYVALYSSPFSRLDDLEWVGALCPANGVDLEWLWSAHNEHRIPLPRLIGVAIARAAGDLRAVLFFDVGLLAAMAASMIVTVRRLRGSTELVDAVFPLLLLTPGAAVIFLILQGISFVLPLAILSAILVLIAGQRDAPGPRRSLAIGLGVFLLPLCGGPGLTTAPALLLWTCAVGWSLRRSPRAQARFAGNILWASAASTVVLIALYFVGFERPAGAIWNPSVINVLLQAWRFLALGWGPAAARVWPWSGVAVAVFALLAAALLVKAWIQDPQERIRAAGIGAMGLSMICMALATGQVRGVPSNAAGFEPRYVPMPALWWCCVLFACVLYAPRILGRCAGLGVIAALLFFLPSHVKSLRENGERRRTVSDAFAVDLAQGLDVEELVRRYPRSFHSDPRVFAANLHAMHDLGMWPALKAFAQGRVQSEAGRWVSPMRIESSQAVTHRWLDSDFVLLVPADCVLIYANDTNARRFEGRFGIPAVSYEKHDTQGVRFTIEASRPGAAAEVLFDRILRPKQERADRGFQEFSVTLPTDLDAELILRTSRQGSASDDLPWAFWTDVRMR